MNHFKSDYPLETFSQQQEIKILLLELQVTSWETQIDDGALKYRRSFMVKRHKKTKDVLYPPTNSLFLEAFRTN